MNENYSDEILSLAKIKEALKKDISDIDNKDKETPWALVLITLLLFNSSNDKITREEYIKMKEDIAELKGKLSMFEKLI